MNPTPTPRAQTLAAPSFQLAGIPKGSLTGHSVLHKHAIAENRYFAEHLSCLVRLN